MTDEIEPLALNLRQDSLLSVMLEPFRCVAFRTVVFIFAGGLVSGFLIDRIYPVVMPLAFEKISGECSREVNKKYPDQDQVLQTINSRNLSWFYIVDANNKVLADFAPHQPKFQAKPDGESSTVEWAGKSYFDAVSVLKNGNSLHTGFSMGPFFTVDLLSRPLSNSQGIPTAWLMAYMGALLLSAFVGINLVVSSPLRRLGEASQRLLDSDEAVINPLLAVGPYSASELSRFAENLKLLRVRFNQIVYAKLTKEHELKKERTELEKEKTNVKKEFDEHKAQAQQSISAFHTKNMEEDFLHSLAREIDTLSDMGKICRRILERLNDKFPSSITHGCFLIRGKKEKFSIEASIGFDDASIAEIDEQMDCFAIGEAIFHSGKYLTLDSDGLRVYRLTKVAEDNALNGAVAIPLTFNEKHLGLLLIFRSSEERLVAGRERILRNIGELSSRSLYRVAIYQQELEAARTDPLTGLYNKKFYYEIVPQIFEKIKKNPEEHPVSFVLLDGDHFKAINDTYGHQVGDSVLSELAKITESMTRSKEYGVRPGRSKDYVIRFGGEEILIIMEDTPAVNAVAVAERLRRAIENKVDWQGGLPHWTISMGVSTYPSDAKNIDELLLQADSALYYAKEELGRNKVVQYANVPKSFRSKKYNVINGDLGIFDPSALLQSIATAQKTGVLTVLGTDERKVWMMYENGKPVQARLEKFVGRAAIMEFITTFEEGSFNFQEMQTTATEFSQKLGAKSVNLEINKGLERCLMDSALAMDNYLLAKKVIRSTNVFVRLSDDHAQKIKDLSAKTELASKEELSAMAAILSQNDDNLLLSDIFKKLDHIPTAVLWRSAALLFERGVVIFETPQGQGISNLNFQRGLPNENLDKSTTA